MNSLKKNIILNIAYQLLVIILPLISTPYVSRVLGANGVGIYSYIYSFVTYFGLFGMLGISNHGNRSIALSKSNRGAISAKFSNIYVIQVITNCVALIFYLGFTIFFLKGINQCIALIQALFLVSNIFDISWLYFGMEKFTITVLRNTLTKILTIAGIFIFVRGKGDIAIYSVIMSTGTLVSQLFLWININKYIDFIKPSWFLLIKYIKPILLLFIPTISYSVYKVLDKIMLGSLSSVVEVGYFDNSEKVISIPLSLITAFGTVMMPRITNLLAESESAIIQKLNTLSIRYFTLIIVGSAFGLSGISDVFIPIFLGNEFQKCSLIVSGLSFSLIFVTWANIIRTQYLIPNSLDKPYVYSTIFGAMANLLINIVLIPKYASVGAMIGTIVAEFVVFVSQLIYVNRKFPFVKRLLHTLPFFITGAMMYCIIKLIEHALTTSIFTLIIQILVGGLFYFIFSCIYLYLIKDEFILKLLHNAR